MSEKVTIEIGDADLADLEEWARNRGEPLDSLFRPNGAGTRSAPSFGD